MTERNAEYSPAFGREIDTPLTRAIDACNFDEAIRIIKAYGHGRHLNEGRSGEKPLQKVLLTKPYCSSRNIVHLQIAKLLVLAGANPNLGTPSHIEDVERDTPFEALISIKALMDEAVHSEGLEAKATEHFVCFGLQGESLTFARDVSEHAVKLLHVFLECGADPNLVTLKSLSTVFHRYLFQSPVDVNTILKFHAAGADLNRPNDRNITPLMSLILAVPKKLIFSLLCEMWPLEQQMSNLNLVNDLGSTALCCAMCVGSVDVAVMMIQRGANLHPCEITVNHNFSSIVNKISICPLLFPLLYSFDKEEEREFSCEKFQELMSAIVAPVFDSIASSESLVSEVGCNLLPLFQERWITELNMSELEITCLIMGKISSSLQQHCVRQIVTTVFAAKKFGYIAQCTDQDSVIIQETSFLKSDFATVTTLQPHDITKLVTNELHLPPILAGRFVLEVARIEMGSMLFSYKKYSESFDDEDSEIEVDLSGSDLPSPSSSSISTESSGNCYSSNLSSSSRDSSSRSSGISSSSEIAEHLNDGSSSASNENQNLSPNKVSETAVATAVPCTSPDSVKGQGNPNCSGEDGESQSSSRYESSPDICREKYEALYELQSDRDVP